VNLKQFFLMRNTRRAMAERRAGVWAVSGIAFLLVAVAPLLGGCTGGAAEEPVKKEKAPPAPVEEANAEAPAAKAPALRAPAAKAPPKAAPMPDDSCRVLAALPSDPPVVLPGKSVVLTRLLKPCVTRDGHKGWQKDTPYLVMGFPCTGGNGRIDITGHHYESPKLVGFILGTDCGMAPGSKEQAEKLVDEALQLPKEAKPVAYTPFVVQFWEVSGMEDADTGYTVELRSPPAVEGLWRKFIKGEPIRVSLYGRENTWAQGDNFYFVEADLKLTGRREFQLAVVQAKSLSKDEIGQVKSRCEALRPRRNCAEVF
jgi:hypothetical protein